MNARPALNAKRNSQGCHGMFKVLSSSQHLHGAVQ